MSTVAIVGAGFILWAGYRAWKIVEAARRELDRRLRGMLYGEAIFHVVAIAMIYALLWSLTGRGAPS